MFLEYIHYTINPISGQPVNFNSITFNRTVETLLKSFDFDFVFVPSALIQNQVDHWTISFPEIPAERWRYKNFRLVLHAQDHVFWYKDLCQELYNIEQHYTPDQIEKIIFIHWDHDLKNIYTGRIKCVEFPSHSFELVNNLKLKYDLWKDVARHNKQHNWICLNGRARSYRQTVWDYLKNEPSGLITHSLHRPLATAPYADYDFDNVKNFINLQSTYRSTNVSLVTESLYQDFGGIITEKTLLAIAARHAFFCIGHRGIHREIKERGFQLFDNVFDLSWDNEYSDTRMQSALDSNIQTLRHGIDPRVVADQVEYNFDYLINDYVPWLRQRAYEQLSALTQKRS